MLGTLENKTLRLQEIYRFPNGYIDVRGKLHWNAFSLFGELKKALLICCQDFTDQVESFAIDTWGVDFGLFACDGNLLSMPRSYRDTHTTGAVPHFAENVMPLSMLYKQSGIQTMQINTLFQLYALKKTGSPILKAASDLLFMPDLLNYFFTGEMKTEYTIASTSQLLSPYTKDWNKPLFDALGIPVELMQEVVFPGEIIGLADKAICKQSGLKQIPVVSVASHDTASAIAAIPSDDQNWAYLSSGTWSLMGIELDQPVINESSAEQNFTNEGGVDGTYRFLKNMCGLWLLQQCKKAWDADVAHTYDQLVQLAEKAEPFKMLIDIDAPDFMNPVDMPGAIKKYCKKTGQEVPQSYAEFVRCIFDSLAMKYRMVMTQLKEHSPNPINKLYVIGGGAKNKLLCQLTANALNMPVVTGPTEASTVGNILIQAKAMGYISSLSKGREIVRNSFESELFMPENIEMWEAQEKRMTKLIETYTNQ